MKIAEFLSLFQTQNGVLYIKQIDFANHGSQEVFNARLETYTDETIFNQELDLYFTPATRSNKSEKKTSVVDTHFLWGEVDDISDLKRYALPPTIVVNSGHGFHFYWKLIQPLTGSKDIDKYNKLIAKTLGDGDAIWNSNRNLRIPNSTNNKHLLEKYKDRYDSPEEVKIVSYNPQYVYNPQDFVLWNKMDDKLKHTIRTGDSRGYTSKSERDFNAIKKLVILGASDAFITRLFDYADIGNKHQGEDGMHYLNVTIEKVRTSVAERKNTKLITPDFDKYCYLLSTSKYSTPLSTYVLEPKVLISGEQANTDDVLIADIHTEHEIIKDQHVPLSSYQTMRRHDAFFKRASLTWTGNETQLRQTRTIIYDQIIEGEIPVIVGTIQQGLHKVNGRYFFVGDTQTLSSNKLYGANDAPIAWSNTGKEQVYLELDSKGINKTQYKKLAKLVTKINKDFIIWPMIGWYTASMLKPWLEEHNLRYPILTATGERGSGKTTTIQRIMMPLFGQLKPASYDATATNFVKDAILGSTTSVPVAFSEFRYSQAEKFLRYILLAYDTGFNPRGRADLTTVNFPLSSPFTVDGEDLIDDAACMERIIAVPFVQNYIMEGTEENKFGEQFATLMNEKSSKHFGARLIQTVLRMLEDDKNPLGKMLEEARKELKETFKKTMPDRIRNNFTIVYFGIKLFCAIAEMETPKCDVVTHSLNTIYDSNIGRNRLQVDELVESVGNAVTSSRKPTFKWAIKPDEPSVVWIQLTSTYEWWIAGRVRQRRSTLAKNSVEKQLINAPYYVGRKVVNASYCHGIDIVKAFELGLDVPNELGKSAKKSKFKAGGR